MDIVVNGRFLQQPVMTGVQRYSREITRLLAGRISLIDCPRGFTGMKGHLWEQFRLPGKAKGQRLWSPANTGPLSVSDQVVTLHDCSFLDRPNDFSRAFAQWYSWLIPRLVRKVRHLITVSSFSADRIQIHFGVPSSKISIVPSGVGPRFSPRPTPEIADAKKKLGISGRYLLALGSIDPRKNFKALLRAWTHISAQVGDLKLVIAGGQASGVFSDSKLIGNAHFTGYVPEELIAGLYSGAEALVCPSLYEGFGSPVLEAMAAGIPVLSSDAPALREVGKDIPLFFELAKPESLESGLLTLAKGVPDREDRVRRGIARAAEFSWEKTAQGVWSALNLD